MKAEQIAVYKALIDVVCITLGTGASVVFGVILARLAIALRRDYED